MSGNQLFIVIKNSRKDAETQSCYLVNKLLGHYEIEFGVWSWELGVGRKKLFSY